MVGLVAGCSTADRPPAPVVVAVAAQPCTTPNRASGVGVVVSDGLVATAAHTVDEPLRELTVDGAPAELVSIDARTDLAVLAAPQARGTVELATAAGTGSAVVAVIGSELAVRITSTGPLVVNDVTDGERHRRDVHRFAPGVAAGTSGAPLLDGAGRLLGIVVLDASDEAYAVTAAELRAVLGAPPPSGLPAAGDCPG